MVHSKSFVRPDDKQDKPSSNTFTISYVNFEGKMITNTYVRHNDNKKE